MEGNKMSFRKYFSLLLVVIFALVFVTAGCGGQQASTEKKESTEVKQETKAEPAKSEKRIRMGMSFLNETIPIAHDAIRMVKAAAEALDVDLVVLDDGFNPDKQVANIENMVASGCQAVMICNSSEAVVPKMIKICEDAKVGFGLFFRTINDPKIKELAQNSKYFIGVTHEDELNNGYMLGKALYKNGSRNVAIINFNHGDNTAETRYAGYIKAFEEDGVKVLAEQWEIITGDKAAAATESFISAFPELDGVVVVGGGGENLAGAISAIKNHNKLGKINVSSTDFVPNMTEALEKKEISAISGGHWVDPLFEFLLLYNWASGNPLTQEKAEVIVNYMFISSPDMSRDYDKWCTGEVLPYTAEEIRNLTVKHNPKLTYQDFLDAAKGYSLDDVKNRHKGMIE